MMPPGAGTGTRPAAARPRSERRAMITRGRPSTRSPAARSASASASAPRSCCSTGRGSSQGPRWPSGRGPNSSVLARLAERGLVSQREHELRRRPRIEGIGAPHERVELSAAQSACVDAVVAALDRDGSRELLLAGVTGSGKTEVYLAAIEAALERGRGAILLVPEIGLTPQTLGRVARRLGDRVAVIHSGLSEGERFDEWRRLRSGEARVCVGPRSAVFAPIGDLGLIVVDEEHDSSYKQEGDPRYDARAVARHRAAEAGAVYLAGSATPRPESWAELERIELPERVDGRPLPPVEVLDMREVGPRAGPLHPSTREALGGLPAGAKAIVMVNRRGFSPHLSCGSCGAAIGCPSLRRLPRPASRLGTTWLPPLRPRRAGAEGVSGLRVRVADPPRRGHRADRGAGRRAGRSRRRSSGSTRTRRRAAAGTAMCSPPSSAPRAGCSSAPRWSPRATTSPTSR